MNDQNVKIEEGPLFKILARENNPEGYESAICLKCELSILSGGGKVSSNSIKIVGLPDCSSALTSIESSSSNFEFKYDEKNPNSKIGNGYLSFFKEKRSTKTKCVIETCMLK